MKKSDLKTGMWVETRIGEINMVLLNTVYGDIIGRYKLDFYTDDLRFSAKYGVQHKQGKATRVYDEDIVKVYLPKKNQPLEEFDIRYMDVIAEINEKLGDISVDENNVCERLNLV